MPPAEVSAASVRRAVPCRCRGEGPGAHSAGAGPHQCRRHADPDDRDYDEDGKVLLSGEAPPGVPVRVYVDNRPAPPCGADAKWVVVTRRDPGARQLHAPPRPVESRWPDLRASRRLSPGSASRRSRVSFRSTMWWSSPATHYGASHAGCPARGSTTLYLWRQPNADPRSGSDLSGTGVRGPARFRLRRLSALRWPEQGPRVVARLFGDLTGQRVEIPDQRRVIGPTSKRWGSISRRG